MGVAPHISLDHKGSAANTEESEKLAKPRSGRAISLRPDDLGHIALIRKQVLIRESLARCISLEFGCAVSAFDDLNDFEQHHADPALTLVILIDENARSHAVGEALQDFANSAFPVIVVSQADDPDRVSELLRSGVRGCIPSTTTIQIALQAIRLVLVGGVFVPANSGQPDGRANPSRAGRRRGRDRAHEASMRRRPGDQARQGEQAYRP